MNNDNINNNDGSVELFDGDSVITLYDENGDAFGFYEIASIEYKNNFYELLQPVETGGDIADDEGIIVEYDVDDESEEKVFHTVSDTDIINAVFELYMKAAQEE